MERSRTLLAPPQRRGERSPSSTADRVLDERAQRRGGLLLGRYRLIERLGAGGFGVVWSAHDDQLDREVALKRIPLPSEEDRERAIREALATARLAHPGIVALYEACADDHAFYLISELVHGDTLAELIAADELADEQIFQIGVALADALAHAHARGVIHRDVKPPNVIVLDEPHQPAGVAKLADFGGAQLAGEDALTRTGDVLGTLAYMAPEQCEGRHVGEAADVYSLALVLYEALTGVQPVRGRTPADTARRIGKPIEPLARHRRDLPRPLTAMIDAALDSDPGRRATLEEVKQALDRAVAVDVERVEGTRVRRRNRAPMPASQLDAPRLDPPQWDASRLDLPQSGPSRLDLPQLGASRLDPSQEESDLVPGSHATPAAQPRLWRRLAVPKAVWLTCVASVAVWQATAGRAGLSMLVLAAGLPLLALPRRSGPSWLAAALAPALGLQGLAGAYPALAGQPRRLRARVGMALLGMWWLVLAEPLAARRLWEGPAVGTPVGSMAGTSVGSVTGTPAHAVLGGSPAGTPARAVWEGSPASTITHVLGSLITSGLAIDMALWAAAAAILPWIVRGRSAALDTAAAIAWTVALLATAPLARHALGLAGPQPRGALLGAVLGCALAVCARAIRGPV